MRIFAFQNQKGMWRDIFITIAQLIVASPGAWRDIEKEKRTQHEFLYRFLHPIFGIIALASFVGGLFIRDGNLENALKTSIISVVGVYGGYFIAAYLLNEMAPRFGLKKDLPRFQQFTGYASVVLYVLFIVTPFLSELFILWLLALYTIYLVNTGTQYFLKVRATKITEFTVVASAVIILSPMLIRGLFFYLIK
ncbi:MAG TPA: hypothetical protein DIC46_14105 [Porphyromonadaceae bacterium]|nr:hypothetical protein [Porphyromonadaceae bacterium]